MIYNMDFTFAALVFLLIILYHTLQNRQWDLRNNRIFLVFMWLGILDVFFDMICTIFISLNSSKFSLILELTLTILYFLQAVVPFSMFCYIQTLRHTTWLQIRKTLFVSVFPVIITVLLILTNHWSSVFYYVSESGSYLRGPLYMGMYLNASIYLLLPGIQTFTNRNEFSKKNRSIIWEMLILVYGSVAVQACYHDILMVGFGISLGITVLFITTQNPYENTDNLTGLYDRNYFHEIIQPAISRQKSLYVLGITIKDLKQINHALGTVYGNYLLQHIAKSLLGIKRNNHVFRIDGNEFVLVTTSESDYKHARKEISKIYQRPIDLESKKLLVSPILSGIRNAEKLNNCDDLLSYLEYLSTLSSEHSGISFTENGEKSLQNYYYRKEIRNFIEQAITEDLFEIAYQPIYSLKENSFVSLEALSRLKHPKYGSVSPELFLELAEKNNQMSRLGYLQFHKICRFIKENEHIMHMIHNVKFNLSSIEILDIEHMQNLIALIYKYNLKPDYFQFEVTETIATEYCDSLYQTIALLSKEGIKICLDDFGSGYANLNTVLKLPFSIIKLDRSLLKGICESEKVSVFYQSIVAVFTGMGYQIVAEGIETADELSKVHSWGVDYIQGYYYSMPLNPTSLIILLENAKNI